MSKKNRPTSSNDAPRPSRLREYFWANLIFLTFVLALAWLVRLSCETPGDDEAVREVLNQAFRYFVFLLGGGFLLVTFFDAGYELFAAKAEEEPQA